MHDDPDDFDPDDPQGFSGGVLVVALAAIALMGFLLIIAWAFRAANN
jgi:hypothetical protein